jgi:hypothetical protein
MRRRIAALLMVVGFMLATAAPAALAQPEGCPGGELQPGQSGERERAPFDAPSGGKPGSALRSPSGDEHDPSADTTGRGRMCGG